MEQARIFRFLGPDYPWRDRHLILDQVDSTNDRLKELARQGAPEGTAMIAERQTGGRGRRGRGFSSPGGTGVYLSILLRPDCAPGDLMHLTCATGCAMCDAVEKAAHFRPGIKWTNDLVWGTKKLGGILTELGLTPQGGLDYAVVGIGINCCQAVEDFPPELRDMAASLAMAAGGPIDRDRVAAAMLESLFKMRQTLLCEKDALWERYRRDCVTLGKDVALIRGDEVRHGLALDVDEEGALIVRFPDGHTEAVNSGEVSVRGMYHYV